MATPKKEKEQHISHVEDVSIDNRQDSVSDIEKQKEQPTSETKLWDDIDEGFDPAEVKATVRKVDWNIIPILSAMYCISLIDRTNLSIARAANEKAMNRDLGLDQGNRYSLATMIFFIPYILFELPSQIGLRKFGVRFWLATATLLWGVVMMCAGWIQTWQQLVVIRALLGIFESVLFPGAAYLIACWYPRKSMATRNTIFYYGASAVGGLSSILGWGLGQMHGIRGYSGWRWIFIIEGILTCMIGLSGYIFLQEFPDRATFLTENQKYIVTTRIQRDRGDSVHDPLTLSKSLKYAMDLKIWMFSIIFFAATLAAYALAYFLPNILQGMGFNNMESQLLFAPPKAWGVIPGLTVAWLCDKYKQRAMGVAFNAVFLVVGIVMFTELQQKAVRYVGVFLAFGGATANVPLTVAWAQTSIRSQSKRAFTSALLIAWGGIGGICSGLLFIEKEAKKGYPTGIYTTMSLNAASVVLAFSLKAWFTYQNRRAERGEVILEGHSNFRYQG